MLTRMMGLSLLLLGSGCGGGEAEPSALFTINANQGQGLEQVYHDTSLTHEKAVYRVRSNQGFSLRRGEVVSPVYDTILGVEFFGPNDKYFRARVQKSGDQLLVVGLDDKTVQSPKFSDMGKIVTFGDGGLSFAVVIQVERKNAVLIWKNGTFEVTPEASWVSGLEPTPDNQTVQYTLQQKRTMYGVGLKLFTKRPTWTRFGDADIWAYKGTNQDGTTVFVGHQAGTTYEKVRNLHLHPSTQQLLYMGYLDKQWTLVSEYRDGTTESTDTVGPFKGMAQRTEHHKITGHYYLTATNEEGTLFIEGAAGNTSSVSPAFKRVTVQRFETTEKPVALGVSEKGQHVLLGSKKGQAYTTIQKLSTADNDSTVAYIADNDDGSRVVLGTTEQPLFDKIGNYALSQPSGRPLYVGTDTNGAHVVHEGKKSPAYQSVPKLRTRSDDRIYWQATTGNGALVGLNLEPGAVYGDIRALKISPAEVVWYDAVTEDKMYRVIETEPSSAYTALGAVVLSHDTHDIVYSARVALQINRSVEDDQGEAQTEQNIKLMDSIVRNTETIGSFKKRVALDNSTRALLGEKSTGMPKIVAIKGSNNIYFTAKSNKGSHVGFNARSSGAFSEISNLQPRPDASDVVWFGKSEGKWSVQEGEKAGDTFDALQGKLSFTPDGQQVYYKGKKDDSIFTWVGDKRYKAVKDMKLNPNGDLLVYAGQRKKGWQIFVSGEPSGHYTAVSKMRFTDDGYGVYADGTGGDESHSLILKRHQKAFVEEGNWEWTRSLTEYHNPLLGGEVRYDETTGLYKIFDKAGIEVVVEDLPDPGENPLFLGFGKSIDSIQSGWIINATSADGLTLQTGPDAKVLERLQGRWSRQKGWVLPLHTPYSYAASDKKQSGQVYAAEHYTRLTSLGFTANGRFHALGRKNKQTRFILAAKRSKPFDAIHNVFFNPGHLTNDLVALKVENDEKYGWVLTDADLLVTSLGMVDKLGQDTKWTSPHIEGGVNTLVWTGKHENKSFQGVHDRRYDQVSNVSVHTSTNNLSYIGHRNGQSSVYSDDHHGPWYDQIRFFGIDDSEGFASYVGDHHYLRPSDPAFGPENRFLSRVHVDDKHSIFADNIGHFFPGTDFASTNWTGLVDGLWSFRTGADIIGNSYQEIGWLTRIEGEKEASFHFLGRDNDSWVEVHDGKEKTRVDAIVELVDIQGEIPSDLSQVPKHLGAKPSNTVLVDEEGRFDYRALDGHRHLFVHQGKRQETSWKLGRFWYLNDGDNLVYEAKERKGIHLVVNGSRSEMLASITEAPFYSETMQTVYTFAKPWSDEEKADDKEVKQECSADDEVEWVNNHAILSDSRTSVQGKSISHVKMNANGVGLFVETEAGWKAWVNGEPGPILDEPAESPEPIWGKSLADSRYVGVVDDSLQVFSTESLTDPLDLVHALYRSGFQDGVFVYRGARGALHRAYVDDELVTEAENIEGAIHAHEESLVVKQIDANKREYIMGDETLSSLHTLEQFDGVLVGKTALGRTGLDLGKEVLGPDEIVYDVIIKRVEEDQLSVSWLAGTLNREEGTVDLMISTKTVDASSLPPLTPLQAISIESKNEVPKGDDEAKKEEGKAGKGKVGKKDAKMEKAKGGQVGVREQALDRQIAENARVLGALRNDGELDGVFGSNLNADIQGGIGGLIGAKGTKVGSGGLGSRGSGLGGGGTAEGLGGLGTKDIGSGASGYGSGGGNFGSKGQGAIATVGGDPVILGALDKSLIDEVIKRHMNQIRYCYQRELTKNPSLGGKVRVKFVIAKNGSVSSAKINRSTMKNSGVENCITGRFLRMQFPKPKGGGIVLVTYPFLFGS